MARLTKVRLIAIPALIPHKVHRCDGFAIQAAPSDNFAFTENHHRISILSPAVTPPKRNLNQDSRNGPFDQKTHKISRDKNVI
jgi:hypothetical protein